MARGEAPNGAARRSRPHGGDLPRRGRGRTRATRSPCRAPRSRSSSPSGRWSGRCRPCRGRRMTAARELPLIGAGVDRVDGPRKVAGAAPYPTDFDVPGPGPRGAGAQHHRGRADRRDRHRGRRGGAGVLTVITHLNAPQLARGPMTLLGPSPPPPLQDDRILHHGQYVGARRRGDAETRPPPRPGWSGSTTSPPNRSWTSTTRAPARGEPVGHGQHSAATSRPAWPSPT